MRFTRLIIISAFCLLMPISKAMAQDSTIVEIVGEPFKTLDNGFQLYEVDYGYPVAVDPASGFAFATDGNHNMINDQVGRVADFVRSEAVIRTTTAKSVINKFTRLGSREGSSRASSSKSPYLYKARKVITDNGPLSISQYISGKVDESSNQNRRRYNAEMMQHSLALSPDQIREKRRALQEAREERQRQNRRSN
ncbi:MAG: hypothetical protein AAF988_08150 [Pseudomonadota bacterium]